MNETTTAATSVASEKTKANYIGEEALEGVTADGYTGFFWTQNGIGLFQPEGSTKVFEVSGDDIELLA